MNYKLKEGKNKAMYDVVETATDQVIKSFPGDQFLKARMFMRHLNLGGGFDSWTPSFFLKSTSSLLPAKK